MVPRIDCGLQSLLCPEDGLNLYCDDEDILDDVYGFELLDEEEQEFDAAVNNDDHGTNDDQTQSFDGGNGKSSDAPPFFPPVQSDECLAALIKKECDYLPAADYLSRLRNGDLDLAARQQAIDWIARVHAHYNFAPLCLYLATKYLDRFLSAYEVPERKDWTMQLCAVGCLLLAAKMEETDVPLILDLQVGEPKFLFEATTIQKMEVLIMKTLEWKLQAVTPFSFIDSFLNKMDGDGDLDQASLLDKSTGVILKTLKGIDFLEFKPSEIAAAVAFSVAGEDQALDIEKSMSLLNQDVEKEKVIKCVAMIDDASSAGKIVEDVTPANSYVPQSPIGVLDAAASLSSKTDDAAVESCVNSAHDSPVAKRRRLSESPGVEA